MRNEIQQRLLREVADMVSLPTGAVNIRSDGQKLLRQNTDNIEIVSKTDKDGIESGTVEIDGTTYRLTLSLDAPKRISGGNFTQGYLADLPKGFTASKLTLKASALAGMSPDELARYDLKRDIKRAWTLAGA